MAAEEDKKFNAVLGGFLVNDPRVRAEHLHCPEADVLAAYHERSLLPEEMNSWKEHVVGCARCQAVLAELEATDSISRQVSEKEEVVTAAASTAAAVGEASRPRKEAPETLSEKARVTPISRRVRWQWLAPVGALAAGLLVWVAWHENRPQVKTPEVTTAKPEKPAKPTPSVTRDGREVMSADEVSGISKDLGTVGGAVSAKSAPEAKSLKQFEKPDSRGRVAHSEPQADKEAGTRADTTRNSLSAANRGQNQPVQDAKAGVAGAVSQTVEVQAMTANAQPESQHAQQDLQAQNQVSEQKASGPNPSRHAEQSKKSKAESPVLTYRAAADAPQPSAPPPAMALNDGASLQIAAAMSPHLIPTPNRKTLWRAGHAGMIEFSSDGGSSWLRQTSNVFADLTAGSAPSEKVCWIVGRSGTIVLTTDAGTHWATAHSPLNEDLGGVRATDALHATVWSLGNTKTFETFDGGATWKPVTSQ